MAAIISVLLGWSFAAQANDANTHRATLESIRHVCDVVDVSLSPDARHVAATVVASTAEGGQTPIWLTRRGAMVPR